MSFALPIEEIKPDFLRACQQQGGAIVSAPPGSGKTTALPLWLLNESDAPIYLLIPKRMAVKLAANQLAANLGEPLGQQVGYSLRNDRCSSKNTRLIVTTYGSFLQLLLHQPEQIEGANILLDEFHERGIDQDLCYALINQYVEVFDDSVTRVIMSATLNVDSLKKQTQLPLIESDGFSFPVDIQYRKTDIHNSRDVVKIIEQTASQRDHHILVFCAGLREIRALERQLASSIKTLILHGQLNNTPDINQLNDAPATVILATNIAESSVTLANVHTVIDLGTERFADINPLTHITELKTRKISQASAKQRAGRAGRLGPGLAIRLWSEDEHASLVAHQPAELSYAEFSEAVLHCAVWGSSVDELPWLEKPAPSRWQLAQTKLRHWQALDANNQLTEHGKAMHKVGLSPWLAHLLVTAHQAKQLPAAALLAATLSQNSFEQFNLEGETSTQKLPSAIKQEVTNLLKRFKVELPRTIPALAKPVLATALVDRICFWKSAHQGLLIGGTAIESRHAQTKGWGVLLDGLRNKSAIIATACISITEADAFDAVPPEKSIRFNANHKTFKAVTKLGNISLGEQAIQPTDEEKQVAWTAHIAEQGDAAFKLSEEQLATKARWQFAQQALKTSASPWPNWPDNNHWAEQAAQFMAGVKQFNQLPINDIWQHVLGQTQLQQLNKQFPKNWQAPTGRAVTLQYDASNNKVVAELKLQECFGLTASPCIANQQVIELHLLAPNGRPVAQVTDLSYFWNKVYPEVRKELRGRYAKHPWPEDPTTFKATAQTNRQLRAKQ